MWKAKVECRRSFFFLYSTLAANNRQPSIWHWNFIERFFFCCHTIHGIRLCTGIHGVQHARAHWSKNIDKNLFLCLPSINTFHVKNAFAQTLISFYIFLLLHGWYNEFGFSCVKDMLIYYIVNFLVSMDLWIAVREFHVYYNILRIV